MKEKKTLLYIGNKLATKGGTVTVIDSLSRQLVQEGYMVITASEKRNKALRLLDMIVTFYQSRKKVDAVLIDTYSTKNFYYATVIGALCRKHNLPYFPILHGGNLPQRLLESPFKSKRYFGGARLNISPSLYLKEAFNDNGFVNVVYIPNTIKIEDYPFKARKTISPKLLWVRSFSEIYNPQLALTVIETLMKKGYDVSLTMVGPEKDGSLNKCKSIAKEKSLPVTFTGLLTKQEWIALSVNHDIFINTTNFDNLPVSIIEAMALGFPIVSTNVGGLPFMIENGVDGNLVPPRDVVAMVKAIEAMCNNHRVSEALSIAARSKSETYDWKVINESWHKVLDF